MKRRVVLAALVLSLSVIGSNAAFAAGCNGSVLLNEDFEHPPSDWKPSGPEVTVVDGKLQISPKTGKTITIPVAFSGASEFEACVTTSLVAGPGRLCRPGLGGNRHGARACVQRRQQRSRRRSSAQPGSGHLDADRQPAKRRRDPYRPWSREPVAACRRLGAIKFPRER
jgi:hypothetical protein